MDRPLRLAGIRLAPSPPTTRTGFLNSLLAPFMGPTGLPDWLHPAPPTPGTLREILLSTKALIAHVDQLGVFDMERVGVRLEPAPSGEPDEVELVLALRERGRLFLKAGTEYGSNEGGGVSTQIGEKRQELTVHRTSLHGYVMSSAAPRRSKSTPQSAPRRAQRTRPRSRPPSSRPRTSACRRRASRSTATTRHSRPIASSRRAAGSPSRASRLGACITSATSMCAAILAT
jgi:outer membrane protein insertion porin family